MVSDKNLNNNATLPEQNIKIHAMKNAFLSLKKLFKTLKISKIVASQQSILIVKTKLKIVEISLENQNGTLKIAEITIGRLSSILNEV